MLYCLVLSHFRGGGGTTHDTFFFSFFFHLSLVFLSVDASGVLLHQYNLYAVPVVSSKMAGHGIVAYSAYCITIWHLCRGFVTT